MISQKAKYAFKALIHLAAHQGETVQIDEIARATGVPRRFLEHILLDLKGRGLIASRRGRLGGYAMLKTPGDITVGEVLRVVDGPVAPLSCISANAYRRCGDCRDETSCAVRRLFSGVYASILEAVEGTTLEAAFGGDGVLIKRTISVI